MRMGKYSNIGIGSPRVWLKHQQGGGEPGAGSEGGIQVMRSQFHTPRHSGNSSLSVASVVTCE